MAIPRSDITGIILAGGQARRMGGAEKGLIDLLGKPLIAHVIARLAPQVNDIIISANRDIAQYTSFGYTVTEDTLPGHAGPLAGVLSAMAIAHTGYLLIVPCDAPLLPPDLVERLTVTLTGEHAKICAAHDGERIQPLFTLLHRKLAASLADYLDDGHHKVEDWLCRHRLALADFSECPAAFININTHEDIEKAEELMLTLRELDNTRINL
ncbi:MAG: molybdenum cofactor guanylyltransferase MobA [Pseudomonadota bacterium]